jgi:hypothetical protein
MKIVVTILSLLFLLTNATAKCKGSGILLVGSSITVNINPVIIIDFFGSSQSLVGGLNKKHPIYLKAGNEKIRLEVIETLVGDFGLTQVVLKPVIVLKKGTSYELKIDKLGTRDEKPEQYNQKLNKWTAITLLALDKADKETPLLTSIPTEIKKTFTAFGCGPAKWVYYNLSYTDNSNVFVKAYLKNTTTGKTTQYIVPVEDGRIKIGHGMCSGGFAFVESNYYEISFSLIDESGNTGVKTEAIPLKQPTTNDKSE